MKWKGCFVERIGVVLRYEGAANMPPDESGPWFQDVSRRRGFLE